MVIFLSVLMHKLYRQQSDIGNFCQGRRRELQAIKVTGFLDNFFLNKPLKGTRTDQNVSPSE